MCLWTRRSRPETARKPIEVYKVFDVQEVLGETKYISPFQRKEYILNKMYVIDGFLEPKKMVVYYAVEKGYHAYTNQEIAVETAKRWNLMCDLKTASRCTVIKCYVPFTAKYLISDDGNEIVSDKIVIGTEELV